MWTDGDEGCLIRRMAKTTKESSVTSVSSFDIRIIFRDPKVSVSSMNTKAEAVAKAANHNRATENAISSCEETAAARGTRLVMKAPCRVIYEVRVSVCEKSRGHRAGEGALGVEVGALKMPPLHQRRTEHTINRRDWYMSICTARMARVAAKPT